MTAITQVPAPDAPYLYEEGTVPVEASLAAAVATLPLGGRRVYLRDFKHITLDAGWTSGIHRHRYCEVDLLLDGHGETASMPVQQVGPGGVLFHAPDAPHAWQAAPGKRCQVLSFGFRTEPALSVIRPARWPVLPDLVTEAHLLLHDGNLAMPGWGERLPLRIATLLSRLLPIMAGQDAQGVEQARQTERIDALDQFLHAHLHRPLALDEIAEHLCMSRRTLTRLVQAHTGSSVMQRLQTFRLIHAAELLSQTPLTLTEIAERTGIPQLSYFCRCFRQHFGCSPTHYRRHLQHPHRQ
jgi:AraC-like DNA-binding protein